MANTPTRSDPIRERYFDAVESAERISESLFYAGAALSLASPFIDKAKSPLIYDAVLAFFVVVVVALFAVGLCLRLYLTPRADDRRRQDFFTSAYNVNLSPEATVGYYNNDRTKPIDRIAAQLLENSHFSKHIALRMVKFERAKVAVYATLWLVAVLNRSTDLGWIAAAAQAVFSEQILSKWFRLEWLRMRFERTFDDMYRLFQSRGSVQKFHAMALDSLGMYETAKANAAVTLSSKIFQAENPRLSAEWEAIRQRLQL